MSSIRATVKLSLAFIFLFFSILAFNYFLFSAKSQEAICGNYICEPGENPLNCVIDCPGYCGDGYCSEYAGENAENCLEDCVVPTVGWLEGWQYRREITITNPGDYLDHYQIMITLDTASLISQGKMREDCGDIRFADSNGVTSLNYWVNPSTCNSPNTEIWVRAVDIPASSEKKIYLYYGNPSAENQGKLWYNISHLGISGGVFDYDVFKMMYRLGVDGAPSHTCVLKSDGTVDCYGDNLYGGANDYLGGDAIAVSAGYHYTCVLKSDGNVDCYGNNNYGQAPDYLGGDALAVSAGWFHTCFLISNGSVFCYGYNNYGQVINYTLGDAIGVSAGYWHTCVLKSDGNVDCYGNNGYRQANDYLEGDAIAIALGAFHTCVIKLNGNVDCYGRNDVGQSNDYLGGDAIGVSTLGSHTCVLKFDGSVDCYGSNSYGQSEDYLGGDAIGVSTGAEYTCVLKTNGNVDCYGRNDYGQSEDYLGGDAYNPFRVYAVPEPTINIGSEESSGVPPIPTVSVVFSYTTIDFGAVEPYTTAEKKGVEFNATIETTADYRILVSATDWSGVAIIPVNTLYFAVNSTVEDLTFDNAKQLSTVPQEIAVFPLTVNRNYHAYYFNVPLVPPGTYTAIVTITYEVV